MKQIKFIIIVISLYAAANEPIASASSNISVAEVTNGNERDRQAFFNCGVRIIEKDGQSSPRHRLKRIVKGENSYHGQWPWIVSLKNPVLKQLLNKHMYGYMNWSLVGSDSHICGGTLITAEWIVTAKHCAIYYEGDSRPKLKTAVHNWTATLGSYNKLVATEQEIDISIDKVIPLYDWNLDYDFAMMHLSTPVNFTNYIYPACLPTSILALPGTVCYGVGWGTSYSLEYTLVNPILKHTTVKIFTESAGQRCVDYTLEEICTSPLAGSVCRGDSGGPLMCQDSSKRWVLTGVAVRASGCVNTNETSIFTSLYHHLDFVYKTINGSAPAWKYYNFTSVITFLFISLLYVL